MGLICAVGKFEFLLHDLLLETIATETLKIRV